MKHAWKNENAWQARRIACGANGRSRRSLRHQQSPMAGAALTAAAKVAVAGA